MQNKILVQIKNAIPRFEHLRFEKPIDWTMSNNEHWAIIGANGSGKSLFIDILLGRHVLQSGSIVGNRLDKDGGHIHSTIKAVAFKDIYSIIDVHNSYYQQRWNKGIEQDTPLVKDLIDISNADNPDWLRKLIDWVGISDLLDKKIDMLSSGELRKFLIVRSLEAKPEVLILDNPFIGLDSHSRIILNDLLGRLVQLDNLHLVLVVSDPSDIPDVISHVLPIKDKTLLPAMSRVDFVKNKLFIDSLFAMGDNINNFTYMQNLNKPDTVLYSNTAILKHIHISYGERTILKDLDWTIKKGEKWALLGANGSGKSTLLSLICGDNPQAYANDITLFDRRRGTGESIWDIKKRIGYISPEMHLYYLKNVKCMDVVSSGFFDTIGLYRKCTLEQESVALEWMSILDISHLKNSSFLNISSGEQRLVLLARLFVKNPDLLILDEPLHGLDIINKKRIKKLIEEFCGDDKSLIYVTHYEEEIPSIIDKRLILTKKDKD